MMMQNVDESSTEGVKGLGTQIKEVSQQLGKINGMADLFGNTLLTTIDTLSQFETKLISSSRSLGQSAAFAKSMQDEVGKAAVSAVQMGASMADVIKTFQNVQQSIGRTVFLSQQFLENVTALQQVGVADETIKSYTTFFDKVGGGFERSTTQQIELVNQAKSYGLNVGTFLKGVGDNLQDLTRFGFPDGVKDLSAMVAKSQLLGNTMDTAKNLANQIMDSPERAYEFAAQMQTLGGSFSQLGDGAQLLYMAQNDLEGLNDQIINAARGIATFNEETGQFEISANERLRLRAVEKMGLDSKAIEEAALRLAKQEKILGDLDLTGALGGLDEEQRQVLASYAQIGEGGKITIEGKDVAGLSSAQIQDVLKGIQGSGNQLTNETDNNIKMLQANTSATEGVNIQMKLLKDQFALGAIATGNFTQSLEQAAGLLSAGQAGARQIIQGGGQDALKVIANPITALSRGIEGLTNLISGAQTSAPPQKVTIDSIAPIKINVESSFNLSDVIKSSLSKIMTDVVNEQVPKLVREQLNFERGY